MTQINYVTGDATKPIGEGNKVIVHCVNSVGIWSSGFVRAVSAKWKQPEAAYRQWSQDKTTFLLGNVQMVKVETSIIVANLIGQVMGYSNGEPPIRYDAIREGLKAVKEYCLLHGCSFHSPQFGAALSGGKWSIIEQIIKEEICAYDIPVTVYEFVDTTSPFYIPGNK